MNKQWNILVVDDEKIMRESLTAWLREDGYSVSMAASGTEAIELARDTNFAICFIDLKMPPGPDGITTMIEIQKIRPKASAIIITAYATVDTAIAAMKEGAQEYIVKPCNPQEISLLVERIIKLKNLERANALLRKKLLRQYEFHDILSKNPRMAEIFTLIKDVAGLKSTVLIQGDSGTGKEMVARAIHREGGGKDKPFVAVPCAALPESLLESELFGYERGAFTGATARRKGKIELADGGTLFLDEIGDISPKMQKDLLRFLQERTFFRVGGTEEIRVDVRVIAATHADLRSAVRKGTFREDLFYRLNVIAIHLPALRDRLEDIPLLAHHFVETVSNEVGKEVTEISENAIRALMSYSWPGNVRELENAVERAIVSCRGHVLSERDFEFLGRGALSAPGWTPPADLKLTEIERLAVEVTLTRTGWNVKEAASVLGIDRSTLYDKIKRYGIERPESEREDRAGDEDLV